MAAPRHAVSRTQLPLELKRWPTPAERSVSDVGEQGADEITRVEGDEVTDLLSQADQLDGDAELGLDREDDAALRASVELREHDPGAVSYTHLTLPTICSV